MAGNPAISLDRQLSTLVKNLNVMSKSAVPQAMVSALNATARAQVRVATREAVVATKIQRPLLEKKIRVIRATAAKPKVTVVVYRGQVAAIRLPGVRTLARRLRGKGSRGTGAVIKAGNFRFGPAGFINKLRRSGKAHVLIRAQRARYPLIFGGVQVREPITKTFEPRIYEIASLLPEAFAKQLEQKAARLIMKERR